MQKTIYPKLKKQLFILKHIAKYSKVMLGGLIILAAVCFPILF